MLLSDTKNMCVRQNIQSSDVNHTDAFCLLPIGWSGLNPISYNTDHSLGTADFTQMYKLFPSMIERQIGAAAAIMHSLYRSIVVRKDLSQKVKLSGLPVNRFEPSPMVMNFRWLKELNLRHAAVT